MPRRALLIAALVVIAPRDGRADRTVEDWVGTWRGAATWNGCTAPGADALAIEVTWRDGALWIDGAAVYEGLGALAPDVEGGGLVVTAGDDLRIEVRPARPARKPKGAARATLALETAARCTMTATLTRDGVGIAACDDLVALGRAATSCGVTVDDDPAADVDGWRALGGKARDEAGAQCTRRAAALRERLVAAECLPSPLDAAELAECRDVWKQASRIARCGAVPAEFKQSTVRSVADLRRSLRSLLGKADGDELARTQCRAAATMLSDSADLVGCP